ncbi:MAG: hypothetical protein AB7K24_11955 [Gemmataceae bacterium]
MTPRKPLEAPAKMDVYVGMLLASLGAIALACILMLIDYSSYSAAKPVEPPAPQAAKPKPTPTSTTLEKG